MTRASKPGLRDVAEHANVSLATASRALSQPELVSKKVRDKIEEACRALRYIPNRTARRLSRDRSETVGVIVPAIGNPLFAPTIDGVREVLDERGLGMLVNSSEYDPKRELKQVRTLIEHGVDAILTMMPTHDPALYDLLNYTKVPVVYLSTAVDPLPKPRVEFDNIATMQEIVSHVMGHGHRRIGVFSGPASSTPVIANRMASAINALQAVGVSPKPEWIVESDYAPEVARAAAHDLLMQTDRPTALICTGDQHAVAAIMEAQAIGLVVPDDLSVTGCNDVAIARLCNPQLTTIRLPYREIGMVACRAALDILDGKHVPESTTIPFQLVARGSVAAPHRESFL